MTMSMEMISSTTTFYGSLKRYWRRRQYQRIDGAITKNPKAIRLGGKRKRTWKIKLTPKLKWGLKIVSPIKLMAKLRDAYINMMLGLAGNVGSLSGDNFFGGKRIPRARKISKVSKTDVFETKLIFEIYKALKASRELAAQMAPIERALY
ncbi:hypothetical protein IFM89_003052 [Coptis chinensis]|uniref:Uncharacterized protein n=1 Tax=Coptis chinensis TaxID=261450 RepID=A0A835M8D5_9MAGN|nr:hypothetical protein IFM89_003052 [Coptis chinensis]